jgi:hypothetical protein
MLWVMVVVKLVVLFCNCSVRCVSGTDWFCLTVIVLWALGVERIVCF